MNNYGDPIKIRQQAATYKGARGSLLTMDALTGVNILLALIGGNFQMVYSAFYPYMMAIRAAELYSGSRRAVAVSVALFCCAIFLVCWKISEKQPLGMAAAAALYTADYIYMLRFAFTSNLGSSFVMNIVLGGLIVFTLIRGAWAGLSLSSSLAEEGSMGDSLCDRAMRAASENLPADAPVQSEAENVFTGQTPLQGSSTAYNVTHTVPAARQGNEMIYYDKDYAAANGVKSGSGFIAAMIAILVLMPIAGVAVGGALASALQSSPVMLLVMFVFIAGSLLLSIWTYRRNACIIEAKYTAFFISDGGVLCSRNARGTVTRYEGLFIEQELADRFIGSYTLRNGRRAKAEFAKAYPRLREAFSAVGAF